MAYLPLLDVWWFLFVLPTAFCIQTYLLWSWAHKSNHSTPDHRIREEALVSDYAVQAFSLPSCCSGSDLTLLLSPNGQAVQFTIIQVWVWSESNQTECAAYWACTSIPYISPSNKKKNDNTSAVWIFFNIGSRWATHWRCLVENWCSSRL